MRLAKIFQIKKGKLVLTLKALLLDGFYLERGVITPNSDGVH